MRDVIAPTPDPRQPVHWGFWGTLIWGMVISFVFVLLQTITITTVLMARDRHLSPAEFREMFISAAANGYFLSLATFVTTIVCTGLVLGIIKLKQGSVLKEYLCIRPVSLKTMLRWCAYLAAFIALADMLAIALNRPVVTEFMSSVYATADPLWMLWVALIFAAPLFEEIFFRGFLFQGIASGFPGPTGAVFVTASLWALIHTQYDAYDRIIIFCLGLLLGAARLRTGSLLTPLALHVVTNLEATLEAAMFG